MRKKKQTLLWKISGKKLPGDSYIFGTMHVQDERAFHYEAAARQKILECDAFALEFNLETAEMNLTAEAMSLPPGMTLESLIRPKKFEKINKRFLRMTGLELRQLNRSIPMQITNLMAGNILSNDRMVALDSSLFEYAKQNEKLLLGIETFEEQLEIMNKIPIENQLQGMLKAFKNIKQFRKQVLKLTELYQNGDIHQLYKSTKKSTGAERKLLLYDRNEIMANRIGDMIQEQTIFCAIGAAHLAGKRGVLRILKQTGLKVKPN